MAWSRSVTAMKLDSAGATPLYEQLAEILREQIRTGAILSNRKLPSVKALQQHYGCAQGTAEHAIRVLKAEALVKSVKGKGVYVI